MASGRVIQCTDAPEPPAAPSRLTGAGSALATGYEADTLLTRGGMERVLRTIRLILVEQPRRRPSRPIASLTFSIH